MSETIQNPHDKLFRETWSNRDAARDFLRNALPQAVLETLELDTLDIAKDSFIDTDLQDYFSDILYAVNMQGQPGYVYVLFEHKSYSDCLIHLQLLEYMLRIWRLYLKQQSEPGKTRYVPIIIPLVLYRGAETWPAVHAFSELFQKPPDSTRAYIPDFHYILHDLSHYADEEIRGTLLSRVVLLLFKHIFDPDFAGRLPGILGIMRELLKEDTGLRHIEMILRYIFNATDNVTEQELHDMVEHSLHGSAEGEVMTLAEQLRKEGYEQGIQTGLQKGMQKGELKGKREGKREGLLEGVELGLLIKFGDDGLKLMPIIQLIDSIDELEEVKETLKYATDIAEMKAIVYR